MVEMAVFVEGTASSLGRDTFWICDSVGNAVRGIPVGIVPGDDGFFFASS